METLRSWAVMICFSFLASAFISFIIPDSAFKKPMKIIISLFLLAVIIWPLSGDKIFTFDLPETDFDDFGDIEDYSQNLENFITEQGKAVVEQNIRETIDEFCSDNFSVSAEFTTGEQSQQILTEIVIVLSEKDSANVSQIKNSVGGITGIVPEVKVGDVK